MLRACLSRILRAPEEREISQLNAASCEAVVGGAHPVDTPGGGEGRSSAGGHREIGRHNAVSPCRLLADSLSVLLEMFGLYIDASSPSWWKQKRRGCGRVSLVLHLTIIHVRRHGPLQECMDAQALTANTVTSYGILCTMAPLARILA
jgi:hypothetical protein